MIRSGLIALWLVCAVQTVVAQELFSVGWSGGGRFTAVAEDPFDPERVIAGSDVAGCFLKRSDQSGFAPACAGLTGFAVAGIAFSPTVRSEVALLASDGLYLSTDSGERFAKIADAPKFDRRDAGSGTVLHHEGALVAAGDDGVVYRLDDRKAKPKPIADLQGDPALSLAVFDGTLYAAASMTVFRLDKSGPVRIMRGLPIAARIADLAATPEHGLVLVEQRTGLYRFDPVSQLWKQAGPAPTDDGKKPIRFRALGLDPTTPGRLFLSTHPDRWPHSLFRSEDNGANFSRVIAFPDEPGHSNWDAGFQTTEGFGFSTVKDRVHVSDWWNLRRSDDGGKSFVRVAQGIPNAVINDLAVSPGDSAKLYAAAADSGLMVSDDGGRSWSRRMTGVRDGHGTALALDPADSKTILLGLSPWESVKEGPNTVYFLHRSRDEGRTFTEHRLPLPTLVNLPDHVRDGINAVAPDPGRPGDFLLGLGGRGIFRVRFEPEFRFEPASPPGVNVVRPTGILVHPGKKDRILLADAGGGVRLTTDGGKSWTKPLPEVRFAFAFAADPKNPDRIALGADAKRLFLSSDAGSSFKKFDLPGPKDAHLAVEALAFLPDGKLLVGTSGFDFKPGDGLFLVDPIRRSAAPLPCDFAKVNALVIRPGAADRQAYIGFNGLGVYAYGRR